MLRKHFHHATIWCQEGLVTFAGLSHPLLLCGLEDSMKSVGSGLIWAKYTKVPLFVIKLDDVPQECTCLVCIGSLELASFILCDFNTKFAPVWENQWLHSGICVRVFAHA